MEVTIKVNGEARTVLVRSPKDREVRQMFNKVTELEKKQDEGTIEDVLGLQDYANEQIIKHSDLTKEEFEDLDFEDADKLRGVVFGWIGRYVDFQRHLSKPQA